MNMSQTTTAATAASVDPREVEFYTGLADTWWDAWLWLICLALLLGGEWFLRKRWGLV